jgi:hypothetical protein
MKSLVKIILRNPLNFADQLDYTIVPHDHKLATDWIEALKKLLNSGNQLEKNFCFMGFPSTARNIEYLTKTLNRHISTINRNFSDYYIPEYFTVTNVFDYGDLKKGLNHDLFNHLHNHFELLQGTVGKLSEYYVKANYETKYAIRQLNNICHEMETLILSLRKSVTAPEWVRPSQITTWLNADRYNLLPEHKQGFVSNGYDRVLGGVYMHWAQIGKTLFEVFRDENAPKLTDTVCEAITHLKYYSGEFDVEWGNDVVYGGERIWHTQEQDRFKSWLEHNGLDPTNPELSLGYLPIGQVDLLGSFGTTDYRTIWQLIGTHLDIYQVEVDGVVGVYDYCWTDADYEQKQIDQMRPGYDYNSRRTV